MGDDTSVPVLRDDVHLFARVLRGRNDPDSSKSSDNTQLYVRLTSTILASERLALTVARTKAGTSRCGFQNKTTGT